MAALRTSNVAADRMAVDEAMRHQLCNLAIGLLEKRRLQRGDSVAKARSFDPIRLEESAREAVSRGGLR